MFIWVTLCWQGTRDETQDGFITLEMPANSCSSFLLGFRCLPPGFPEKNSAFWMPSFSAKGKNWKYWELLKASGSCHAWALGNLSLYLSLHPGWSPGARQLQLLSKEGNLLWKWDLLARSHLCPSPLCTDSDFCLSQFSPYKPGLLQFKV